MVKEKILHEKNTATIMRSASEKELNYEWRATFIIKIGNIQNTLSKKEIS